ncbi:TPA: hypothetical protein MI671_10165 [Klebsiella pneumoniae]|uniref:hypothetical protein n=1 Tax=Klebsiella pneumoniae TaxID=573 RepID=UPI002ACB348C|nr:hypothetical protein [Klebsiella pneumoniae]HBY7505195.1 hypothetical protein [Klebsiella pneumoniae]HDK5751447.1 hypothetical protein [Klebsiella pneumoniae]HEN4938074.1 hypothetical protein [Klebsiella pneumoniae]
MSNTEKKFGHSIYYMNDQNIRDGLLAQKVKVSHLIKILKERNIIVSPLSSKEELINMLKFIRFDYYEYVYLSSILANQDKKESKSSIDIDKKVTSKEILSTFDAIKGVLEARQITAEVSQQNSKKIIINFEYVEFDHSKPPMRQKSFRKGVVECDITATGAMLNYPANKVGAIIKDQLITQLSQKLDTELKPIEFDFEHSTVSARNNFFLSVINSVEKYDVFDVVTVAVKKIEDKKGKDSTSSSDSNNDLVGEAFTGEVRNAILRGNQILTSKIYSGLNSESYYIYKITWKIREIIPALGSDQSDCYTVEIEFSDKDKAKGLKYCVKTVQRFSTKNKLNITTDNPLKSEQEKIGKLIYKTALDVYSKI